MQFPLTHGQKCSCCINLNNDQCLDTLGGFDQYVKYQPEAQYFLNFFVPPFKKNQVFWNPTQIKVILKFLRNNFFFKVFS